jgi:hypothetical protein
MNLMRKLAWAAVLATSGAAPSAVTSPPASATPAAPAPAPAAAPPGQPATVVQRPPSRWFANEDDDLGDDEFEGEGWGFWGL